MATRFCRFCGKELVNPGAKFCPSCGQPIAPVSQPKMEETGQTQLIIRIPGQAPYQVPLTKTVVTIGRRPDNDVVVPPDYVSGYHGRLELQGGVWVYTDLGSTNGTYINGMLMQSAQLKNNDILRIGDPQGNSVSLTLQLPQVEGAPTGATGVMHMGSMMLGGKTSVLIGRNPQADIPLSAPVISWQHARLDQTQQGYVLTDLNSTNGTFVNGQRIVQPTLLKPGDVIQIGPFKLVNEAAGLQQYATTGGVRLDGLKLTREVGKKNRRKRILNDVNICIYPREFVALVGGSGAGKSTLLKALNGFTRAEGQVLVNGDDLYDRFDLYRTLIGYVPQDDIIHKELTVENALRYAARLRLPPDTSSEEIERRVDRVLQQVEMSGQKQQPINNLSGGQRKRVSIAVELLAEPNLFFLDEPTSGLDPGLDKKMMQTLRHLADGGRTVLLVTHATANITQCDLLCFMAQGRMVYFGPPEEARKFFGVNSDDFADIYSTVDDPDPKTARQKAQDWEERYRRSPYYEQYVLARQQTLPQVQQQAKQQPAQRGPRVNPVRQFGVLTRRYIDLVFRDRLLLTVLMAIMPIIGLLLLLISDRNWLVGDPQSVIESMLQADLAAGKTAAYFLVRKGQTLLFMMGLASVLLGLFAAAYEIVKEQAIYQRERMVTLRLVPYLFSKVIVLSGFAIIQCLLLIIVVSLGVQFPTDGVLLPAPVEMYITLVLGALVTILMGLFISSLVPNTNTVIYIILLLLFFQIIFAGVFFDLPGFSNKISYLTQTRWVVEALGISSDMNALNELTQNMFDPDPMVKEVSYDAPKIAEDWKPITIITETQEIEVLIQPGITRTVPISVPSVIENELITVTETVTKEVTVDPEPVLVTNPITFQLDYSRTASHLLRDWGVLIGFGVLFSAGTLIILKRKDIT